ncbi:MAG: LptA/OstA family protein [bacterium]
MNRLVGARLLTVITVGLLPLRVPVPAAAVQSAPLPVEVSGAAYAEFDARAGVWILRGAPVVITRGATRLEAAQIRYAERSGIALASGRVVVRHETITLRAAEAEGRLREQYVLARGEVALMEQRPEGEARLTAGRLEAFLRERRVSARDGPVLTHRDGTLRGSSLTYEWETQTAVAGAAEVTLPEGRMSAERITAAFAAESLEAVGMVRLSSQDLTATAPRARIDRRTGIAHLSGGVLVRRGPDTLSAETVTADLRTRRVVATGAARLVIGASGGH